ncbi:MAG: FtsX-like permease family protein [Bacteroidota bacterium]
MLRRHIILAFRVFLKHTLNSLITLVGLSTGIGCFLLLSLYVYDEYQTDRFHKNYEDIYHVNMRYYVNDQPMFNIPPPAGLFNDISALNSVQSSTRAFAPGEAVVSIDGQKFIESGVVFVDSSWRKVFDFSYQNESFSAFADPSRIIVSEKIATKYFRDKEAIGQSVIIDNEQYIIDNVLLENDANSSFNVDFLISFNKREDFGIDLYSYENGHTPYFIVAQNEYPEEIKKNIQEIIDKKLENPPLKIELTSLEDFYFMGSTNLKYQNAGIRGNKKFYKAFALIAVLILAIAIINYINLVTARATDRSKEVGIKKTIGVGRKSLILQFQTESLVLTLIAGLLAIGLAELFIGYLNQLMTRPINDSVILSWEFLFGYAIGLILVAIVAGLYPSFILSSYNPISAVNDFVDKVGGKLWLRNSLIAVQFTITTVLIFGSVVIMKQMTFLSNFDLGFDSDQILSIKASSGMQKSIVPIKQSLLAINGVENISVGNLPGIGWMYSREFQDETVNVAIQKVDEDFFDLTGIELLEGRVLSGSDAGTTNTVINKTMRDLLFGDEETFFGKLKDSEANLVGVVSDFQFTSAKEEIRPLELKMHENQFRNILLRLDRQANSNYVIDEMRKVMADHVPDDIVDFNFLDEDYDSQFKSEQLFLNILKNFTMISVLIGAIGLFGLAQFAFVKNQRNIGVRKILGASDRAVIQRLASGLLLPVVAATIIGLPAGYYLMTNWLSDYSNRIELDWPLFTETIVCIVAISVLTILYQVFGAIRLRPINALRDN